jgi:chloramphenicol-sensitive protein RarD
VSESPSSRSRAGFAFGLVAYTWWGLIPLYFRQVKHISAWEILANRIVWSILILVGLTTVLGNWSAVRTAFRTRKVVRMLALSATLLAINWLLYIYSTIIGKVAEASLGYYMLPLVNAFLGTMFLGERLRAAHYPALVLIAIGVMIPTIAVQDFPWLGVLLAITFGLYGLVRKMAPVDSVTGLMTESTLLLPFSLGYMLYLASVGRGRFGVEMNESLWLMAGGIATVVPLVTFAMAVKRLPLVALTFIQFISPTVQLLLAVLVLNEVRYWYDWAAAGCVLTAVSIFLVDAALKERPPSVESPSEPLDA